MLPITNPFAPQPTRETAYSTSNCFYSEECTKPRLWWRTMTMVGMAAAYRDRRRRAEEGERPPI